VLYVVLLLVLAALGLLVPALTTSQSHWAWSSVGASAAAALVLLWDWWRHRRRTGRAPAAAGAAAGRSDQALGDGPVPARDDVADAGAAGGAGRPAGRVGSSGSPARNEGAGAAEPAEEGTDAADALIVADLPDEVRVLDERPRYHLAACEWLGGRASLGLPVSEARQLGFTPCAVCGPDSALAAKKRSSGL